MSDKVEIEQPEQPEIQMKELNQQVNEAQKEEDEKKQL